MMMRFDPSATIAEFWGGRGLSNRVAWALAERRIADVVMLRALGRKAFLLLPNMGGAAADEVDRVVGWVDGPAAIKAEPTITESLVRIADALEQIAGWLNGNGPPLFTDRIADAIQAGLHGGRR